MNTKDTATNPIVRAASMIAVIRHIAAGSEGLTPGKARSLLSAIKIAIMKGESPAALLRDVTDEQIAAAGFQDGRASLIGFLSHGLSDAVAQVKSRRFKRERDKKETKAKRKLSKDSRKANR